MGLVVRGKYAWCLVIFAIFMGFGGAEVGDVLKSSFGGGGWGVAMQATRRGFNFNGEGGVGFSLYVILLC